MSLTVSGLSKKYHNKTANRDVSFEIGKGINGLLGANGAGKTTLMRMICGVVKPDSGSISLDGIEVGDSEYLKGIITCRKILILSKFYGKRVPGVYGDHKRYR